jgi:diguanylate cyclase (GGDEF)-like protein
MDVGDRIVSQIDCAPGVLDHVPVGIWQLSADEGTVYVNPAFCVLADIESAADLGELPVYELFTPDSRWVVKRELAKARGGVTRKWQCDLLSRTGRVSNVLISAVPLMGVDGLCRGLLCSVTDVTALRLLEKKLVEYALRDPLTGLPNRALLVDRLEQAMARAQREHTFVAVLFLDLDNFKTINDVMGHSAADAVLQETAQRLKASLRKSDTVARVGGDEFIMVVANLADPDVAGAVGDKLLHALAQPIEAYGHTISISGSIGMSVYPRDAHTSDDLLRYADGAMYRAKSEGKSCARFFSVRQQEADVDTAELATALPFALGRHELFLDYQPVFDLRRGALSGFEALLRWRHPQYGVVGPDRFIRVTEQSALVVTVGNWVLHEACAQAARWQRELGYPVRVAVNISPTHFAKADFVDTVAQAVSVAGIEPSALAIELTERVLMGDVTASARKVSTLRALGASVTLDDFGTGYSSLNYLHRLAIDTLKIDKSFILDPTPDGRSARLVEGVTALARALGVFVVAEGVETEAQLDSVIAAGCDAVQGFLTGRPAAPAEWAQVLEARGSRRLSRKLSAGGHGVKGAGQGER